MKTKETVLFIVDKNVDNLCTYPQIVEAAKLFKKNEVVAFPTETVYGLGGNAKSDEAVEKIFKAKGRPSDNPLIIHISNGDQLREFVVEIPEKAKMLMDHFWPGPLTIIFLKKENVLSDKATANLSTVAVRMPDHPVALALIEASQLPIAAPSANRSGKPSPTTAKHVQDDLGGKIAAIVDGGATGVGVESTVIDCTTDIPTILRPGGVTREEIEAVIGKVNMDPSLTDTKATPKSPGMKYTHYAPKAPLYIVKGDSAFLQSYVDKKEKEGLKVGILTTEENEKNYRAHVVLTCGKRSDLESVAKNLYRVLREFNETDVDVIVSETFPTDGVGEAIMNRLMKAAGYKVVEQP